MVRLRPPSSMSNVVPRLQIWWMIALWCQLAAGVREPVKSQDIDEKAEILKPLNPKEMKDVFGLMEERYNFQLGLQKALEDAKTSGGTCPAEGRWKNMGCAPFSETLAEMKCHCPKVWGLWPRMCLSHQQRDGELEEHLDFQTAREIYAGVCSLNTRHIHQKALVIMALLVGSMAAWCVFSGRAAAEMGAAQEEGSHKEAEEAKTDDRLMEEQEQQRQEKFNHLVENSESLRDLAFKVSALPEPPVSFTPIKSNIYRYWALGGKKRSWLHYFGLRFVFLIQLVAPFAILQENYFKWDFHHSQIRFVEYEYGSNTHGVSHLLGRLLEFCFIYCIGLHSLSIIKKAAEENSMLSSLFDELKRRKDDTSNVDSGRKVYVGRWSQTCLLLDCVMICYVITLGLVDMVAIFSDNGGPKDVVFDSLALLFIFHLHEVEGGLTFVSIQDFNERRVGELCARISQATDPEAEKPGAQATIQQKLARKRIVLRTQRRSALFFVTETLIYIILLLVPVFQLFIQDGLQARSNAISEGTLGAHIVQEEALLVKAMKSFKSES